MKFLSSLLLIFILFSCSDMKKGKQLEQIEILQSSLDSLERKWLSEEIKIIDSLAEYCSTKIDSIGLLYEDQQVDLSVASKVDLFKQCNNDLKELKRVHTFYPIVLKEKKQLLEALKKDIIKGNGRREKYDEYIDFEENELSTIREQYHSYKITKERCITYYSSSKETVTQLLSMLRNTQNQTEIAK